MISKDRIQQLYDRYLELVLLEIVEFGVKPTEVRHLIGRLGEFYCALQIGGELAHHANQQGFDVICRNGRRVSVKTTAQITGFVPIRKATLDQVDDIIPPCIMVRLVLRPPRLVTTSTSENMN
jgi:hypothetical protein